MIQTTSWDIKYLELAKYIANTWSKDPSTKVGAIVVNYEHRQEFIGYNGFPDGVRDSPERLNNRNVKLKFVTHAEVNAILKAGQLGKGATLYVYPSFTSSYDGPAVCNECAKIAIQAGIKEVVSYEPKINNELLNRWKESIAISRDMFIEAGITWRGINDNN